MIDLFYLLCFLEKFLTLKVKLRNHPRKHKFMINQKKTFLFCASRGCEMNNSVLSWSSLLVVATEKDINHTDENSSWWHNLCLHLWVLSWESVQETVVASFNVASILKLKPRNETSIAMMMMMISILCLIIFRKQWEWSEEGTIKQRNTNVEEAKPIFEWNCDSIFDGDGEKSRTASLFAVIYKQLKSESKHRPGGFFIKLLVSTVKN